MTRPALPIRSLFAWIMLACLFGAVNAPAWADSPTVTAVFGLGGRYRPGGWSPVTVKVHNPSADALDGQVQALSEADPNANRYGRPAVNAPGTALFSRPVSVPGGGTTHTQLYTDGLDPGAGSVTVQVADGRTRGDGRIWARGSSAPNGNSLPDVTGTPVTDLDLFLVGFGGDPGAFTGLNGQKTGLVHLPGVGAGPPSFAPGVAAGQTSPPTGNAQVVSILPADLPDRPVGYSGVDAFLLRGDAPLDALSEAQADALKDWVAGGGHLVVVCPGANPGPYSTPFFQGLLPATVQATGKGTLTLTPRTRLGVHTPAPMIVTGPYGAGWVSVTTRDLAATPPSPALWAAILTTPRTLLGAASAHDMALAQNYYGYNGNGSTLLSSAVLRGPSLDAPGTWVIGLFLLAYLIVLVPVNYLILKRLDRRELAWATIPALVVIFAVGTFGVGYAAKGGSVFVNRAAIVETAAGQTSAGVRGAIGLFSPRRTSYDISLPGTALTATLPPTVRSSRFGGEGDAQPSGQTRLVQRPEGAALLDTAVNMWAMRAFDFQSTTDLGGTVDVSVAGNALTVTNHTPHTLTNCQVIRGGTSYPAGPLAPGGTAQVSLFSLSYANPQTPGLPLPQMSPGMVSGSADQSVTPRMQSALSEYARSLGQPDNGNGYYYNGQVLNSARPAFAAAPNEALLVGWSDDPALAGPAPRVDGHAVPVHSTTLVVVHLPLPASLTAQSPPPVVAPPITVVPAQNFGTISKSSALYRKAVDVRTLAVTPKTLGKSVTVRGVFRAASLSPGSLELTIAFRPQIGGGAAFQEPTLRVPIASYAQLGASYTRLVTSLQNSNEVVATGTLERGPNGPQIVPAKLSQIKVIAGSFVRTLPAPPPPPFPTRQYGFNAIPQTALVYRKALDARTLAVTPKNANKRVMVRGLVTGNAYTVSPQSMIVTLGSQTLLLMSVSLGEQFRSLAMMHREVVVTGLLTRRGNSPQIAVTHLSQVLLVGSGPYGMAPSSGPVPGNAYARFSHIPRYALPYRQALDVKNFIVPTRANQPFQVRGFATDSSLSQGKCKLSLQSVTGSGPKVIILLPAPYQIQNTEVQALIGHELLVSGTSNNSSGAGSVSLISQPSQVLIVDNSPNIPIR